MSGGHGVSSGHGVSAGPGVSSEHGVSAGPGVSSEHGVSGGPGASGVSTRDWPTGLRLDAAVPHPPFGWSVGVPGGWALLDTAPATADDSAARLVDGRFPGLAPAERRGVLGVLAELATDCRQAGAALSVLRLGRLRTGVLGAAGLHLGWHRGPVELGTLRAALPRTGLVEDVGTPVGTALLHADVVRTPRPGTADLLGVRTVQLFLPVPRTSWTAVLSAGTAHPELYGVLPAVVRAVARSLRPWPEPAPGVDR